MINKSDLRDGIWVRSIHTGYVQVSLFMIGEIADDETYLDHLMPIPLNPEILEKAGFKLETKVWWKFPGEDISGWVLLSNSPVDESFSLCYDQLVLGTYLISNLHQLQNLYYSLNNKELNITL